MPFTDAEVIRLLDELETKGVIHLFEYKGSTLMAIDPFPGDRTGIVGKNERYGPRRRPTFGTTETTSEARTRPISKPGAIHVAPSDPEAPVDPIQPDDDLPDDFPEDFLEPPKNDPV